MKGNPLFAGLLLVLTATAAGGCKDYLPEEDASSESETRSATAFSDYYWYRGERIPLDKMTDKYFVLYRGSNAAAVKASISRSGGSLGAASENEFACAGTDMSGSGAAVFADCLWAVARGPASRAASGEILYMAPYFTDENGKEAGLSNLFYVKLKSEADRGRLETMAADNRVQVIGRNVYMPLWYTLGCTVESSGNALEMANLFYESGSFAAAEPDLVREVSYNSNDPYFPYQWNLENTGQNGGTPGLDIRFSQAGALTLGSFAVTVAVIDQGIQLDHPDLPNIHPSSYDAYTNSSPSAVRGPHGVPCAGIIGAKTDNGVGVAGVAPNCRLMSVSNHPYATTNSAQDFANGFNFAVQNGADVISNSWGHESLKSDILEDAIENALRNGRGGKGCVVCFAAGNDDAPTVSYPAKAFPEILAVGAMSPCGERKNPSSCDGENWWGSNYGTELDIVAPGVLVPSADLTGAAGYNDSGDYLTDFNGTSSATPHAAGVAALVLSVDPALTGAQVNDIIERTARKVGPYSYTAAPGRPNGTWNIQTGYGLLDALGAVTEAMENRTVECSNTVFRNDASIVGKNVTLRKVTVTGGGKLSVTGRESITVVSPFTVHAGSQLELTN